MPASKDVALEPALKSVFAEHLHDAAVGGDLGTVGVFGEVAVDPGFLAGFVDDVEFVGGGLIGAEDAKAGHVAAHGIA